MIKGVTTLHSVSFLAIMRYNLVLLMMNSLFFLRFLLGRMCGARFSFQRPLFRLHQAPWNTCFALSICHSAVIRGDSVRSICHIWTAILKSLLYDSGALLFSSLFFYLLLFHPITDDIYLQRIFFVVCQKKCWADSFPFHLIIRLTGPCCC